MQLSQRIIRELELKLLDANEELGRTALVAARVAGTEFRQRGMAESMIPVRGSNGIS